MEWWVEVQLWLLKFDGLTFRKIKNIANGGQRARSGNGGQLARVGWGDAGFDERYFSVYGLLMILMLLQAELSGTQFYPDYYCAADLDRGLVGHWFLVLATVGQLLSLFRPVKLTVRKSLAGATC